MKLKTYAPLILTSVLLIFFIGCDSQNKSEKNQLDTKETLAQLDMLLGQLEKLEVTGCKNIDGIVIINEKIRGLIENIRTSKKFDNLVDTFNKNQHRIDLVVSEDEQFAIFSWETKMDCLGNQIKNIALYKTNEKVRVSSLYGTPMLYREISQTELNHQMYYILGGNTAENTSKVTQKIYKITNGYIEEAQIPLQELSYNKKSLITFDE